MQWIKLGKIFCANGENDYMQAAGRAPVALQIQEDVYKVFFSSYDSFGRGRIFALSINLAARQCPYNISMTPLIGIGDTGCFDDNGIIPSCVLYNENKVYLYTSGFSVKNKLIFDSAAGLAISLDNGMSFNRFQGPVLDRSIDDPCFATSPFVLFDEGVYKMWYVSCCKWQKEPSGTLKHFYNIRYKESDDPIYWPSRSTIAIDFANDFEYAIARPVVFKNRQNSYEMWYCFRAQPNASTYRIGYAVSENGKQWNRRDSLAGINVSSEGWDSEMICYPYVFEHKGRKYMLYNGNGYGKTGFGLAVLED